MRAPAATDPPVDRPAFAYGPVLSAVAALAVLLLITSERYGYHRDELYFRMLRPAWGYVDQPFVTPWLARTTTALSDHPWALRLPAMAAVLAAVLVVAAIAREVGGGGAAQGLAAWGFGFAPFTLSNGHQLLTSSLDLLVWPVVVLLVLRALLRDDRWWLAVGAVVGAATANKLLVAVLLLSSAVGLAVCRQWSPLRSRWFWGGVAVAAVLAAPTLAYQAGHDWPQVRFGRALAEHNAGEVRVMTWVYLLLLLGPVLVPLWWRGLVALWKHPDLRPARGIAVALPVAVVLTAVMGSQPYYYVGLLAAVLAIGCARVGRPRGWAAAVALNSVVAAAISLPVLPLGVLARTPVTAMNPTVGDTVGWPAYVRQVQTAYDALPPSGRARAVVLASNYGEAGALDRFGSEELRAVVVSGHNALADERPPAPDTRVVVVVGAQFPSLRTKFASCEVVDRLDNGVDVDNEEQGEPVAVCRDPRVGWDELWQRARHLD
ncbi:glycosyltransferase family 39 protein [Luteipulveratus halotolerans]|uniref:Glycosyltransferase RgtA/B/C/D-like domain-containing protein n=1 Tax=Luteipulveratus halotolerans TaxID=1631356 RepID=A0A0L6CE99_9MICO|nr:glycosyltransferase family 39 protein [Luteipulveratus halotolerans]KNX35989.1 hypothetical protein VV01_00560 [Luteipulveratus halotolerans]